MIREWWDKITKRQENYIEPVAEVIEWTPKFKRWGLDPNSTRAAILMLFEQRYPEAYRLLEDNHLYPMDSLEWMFPITFLRLSAEVVHKGDHIKREKFDKAMYDLIKDAMRSRL